VAKRITDIPGASEVFAGAVVAYENEAKMTMLTVKRETLEVHGAVSEEVAAEMAAGVMAVMGTDLAVSTTGIAGPGGGSASKPVGMVCFGMADSQGLRTHTRIFSGDRERIRIFASLAAIEMLRDHLAELPGGTIAFT
jgi:nicotinamide-nucleotide amidase